MMALIYSRIASREVEAGDRVADARRAHRQARRQRERHVVGPGHAAPPESDAEVSGRVSAAPLISPSLFATSSFTVTHAQPRRRLDAEGFVPTVVRPLAGTVAVAARSARRYERGRRRRRR